MYRQKNTEYGSGRKKTTRQAEEKMEGLQRRGPEGERVEWRGGRGQSLMENTSEEQRPHMNMEAAAKEQEQEKKNTVNTK